MRRGDVVECGGISDLPTPQISRDSRCRAAPFPLEIIPAAGAVVAE
ncbi:hypothetical protein [Rhodococcus globerulus]|nr:hypothetical protein [Rhodococcus globerulus]